MVMKTGTTTHPEDVQRLLKDIWWCIKEPFEAEMYQALGYENGVSQ